MKKSLLFSLSVATMLLWQKAHSQSIARLTVAVENSIAAPVYINLDELTNAADSLLLLREITDGKNITVPFQVEQGYHRFLWWMIKKENFVSKKERVFELVKLNAPKSFQPAPNELKLSENNGALAIESGEKKVLQYNFGAVYPPAGVDTVFKRSGFIHPLWSPSGNILTQISPKDHYHHMGIWNPWTLTEVEGKTVDFWNLGDKKGTVRFAGFISKNSGPVYAGFKALQEHIAFDLPFAGSERKALNETWDIRVYNIDEKIWLWDFTSNLNCADVDSVILKEYRYGGFGFRATPEWNNQNSKVLTSEGKNRKEADGSNARWCMIDGDMNTGHSGLLFMGFPANYNFPEPLRVWPEDANKRGDVFFNFSPTKNKDWALHAGKNYALKYRILVYDGSITARQAEEAWKSFAHPPKITISKIVK